MTGPMGLAFAAERDVGEISLSDSDIVDAMGRIPGYLDISTEDFRVLYHLAHHNAVDRLAEGICAATLMHGGAHGLTVDMTMAKAARTIVASGYKGLPVIDQEGRVVGILTETDFLKRMKADTFLELMLRLIEDAGEIGHRCHETPVGSAMTAPVTVVNASADFRAMLEAFRRHPGRAMPVVDGDGRLLGMLLRKDLLAALTTLNWEAMP